jgi:hypothetical protein
MSHTSRDKQKLLNRIKRISGEGEIRRKIVEADLVDCIVALPAQLFFTTGTPVCLWFLTRDKTGRNIRRGTPNRPGGRVGETLFIDARKLRTMQTRVLRVLTGIEEAECVPGTGDPLPTSDVRAPDSAHGAPAIPAVRALPLSVLMAAWVARCAF